MSIISKKRVEQIHLKNRQLRSAIELEQFVERFRENLISYGDLVTLASTWCQNAEEEIDKGTYDKLEE